MALADLPVAFHIYAQWLNVADRRVMPSGKSRTTFGVTKNVCNNGAFFAPKC